jgi:hypothetical protein
VQQQLLPLRIIWGALLMGQVMYLALTTLVLGKSVPRPDPAMTQLFLYVAVGMLAVMIPTAFVVRAVIYRGGRDEDGLIAPAKYATGNIVFWAMCEGVGLAAITFGLLNQGRGPVLFVAAVAIAVQVVNFPTGIGVKWE